MSLDEEQTRLIAELYIASTGGVHFQDYEMQNKVTIMYAAQVPELVPSLISKLTIPDLPYRANYLR